MRRATRASIASARSPITGSIARVVRQRIATVGVAVLEPPRAAGTRNMRAARTASDAALRASC